MFRKTWVMAVCALALVWAWSGSGAYAQGGGGISGTILDSSGAVVSGATVTITSIQTGEKTTVTTTREGYYAVPNLRVGTYTVAATFSGFNTVERTPVVVSTGKVTTVDMELQPGRTAQTVTVTGTAPQMETTTGQLSTVVEQKVVDALPLAMTAPGTTSGRRNIAAFVFLTPGVTVDQGRPSNIDQVSVNGSSNNVQETLIDGAVMTASAPAGNMMSFWPQFESVGEFNIQNVGFESEYTRGLSVFNFTFKSGSNQLHGDLFDYLENEALNARGFFAKKRPVYKQNEFGVTVGGPILIPKVYDGRDKTFFFFTYSGLRFRQGPSGAGYVTLPTVKEKQGDFSELLSLGIKVYDPATQRPDGAGGITRDAFPGNIIDPSLLDPVSAKYFEVMPDPDIPDKLYYNYLSRARQPLTDDGFTLKFDHSFSERHRATVTHFQNDFYLERHYEVDGPLDPGLTLDRAGGGTVVHYYATIRPNLVNDVMGSQFGFHWNRGQLPSVGSTTSQDVGIPNFPVTPGYPMFWAYEPGTPSTIGSGFLNPLIDVERQFEFRDTLSWMTGKHQFKFGVDMRWSRNNYGGPYGGIFYIYPLETSLPNSPNPWGQGDSWASFYLGRADYGTTKVGGFMQNMRDRFQGVFVSDIYRITRKLTLNIGVGIDHVVPYFEAQDRMSGLSLTTPNPGADGRLGALVFAGFGPGHVNKRSLVDSGFEWAPRLGLAYALNDKTVIRGSAGVFYAHGNGNASGWYARSFTNGWDHPITLSSLDSGVTPGVIFREGFPAYTGTFPNLDPTLSNQSAVDFMNPSAYLSPTNVQWTFGFQRQIGNNTALDMSYVGTHGYHLPGNLENLNQVPVHYLSLGGLLNQNINSAEAQAAGIPLPYPGFTGSVAQALRPYPQYTGINDLGQPTGMSWYNGLQVKVQRRLSQGLNFLAAYALSKTLENNGTQSLSPSARSPLDAANPGWAKSIGRADQTHILTVSYLYQLPFGPGKRFANVHGVVGKVVGGWETAGILQYTSGTPLTVSGGGPIPLFGGGNVPNVIPGVPIRTSVSPGNFDPAKDRYLNIDAFSNPAPYTFGTMGPYLPTVRGFPMYNENLALIKDTHITESKYVQYRLEMFNAFNRVVFANAGGNLASRSTFGIVNAQRNNARLIQMALKFYF